MSRLIVLCDPTFPVGEGMVLPTLKQLDSMVVSDAYHLASVLEESEGGCFVNLHAPYFPKDAWSAILEFLKRGGGLISVGGAPFKRPVRRQAESWHAEVEQTGYHRQLRIHETLPVDAAPVTTLTSLEELPLFAGIESLLDVADTWNLVPHVTKSSDLPEQMGAAGPMDARIYPVLKGRSTDQREVAAPAVLWENIGGDVAGARWLFVNQPLGERFWQGGGAQELAAWAAFCARGVTDLWIKPGYASYEPGERPSLTVQAQSLARVQRSETWSLSIHVVRERDATSVWEHRLELNVTREIDYIRLSVPLEVEAGFYRIEAVAESAQGERRVLHQGLWGRDDALLAEGTPIRSGRDYFEKDGRPLPVVGMTYMTSDVARKYLFLPNAAVWDRDMAQMARAGINWIRTGVWTAWRNMMQVDGHASEEVMRAIDAFLLTAKKHGLQTTFTFFSFTPETWEGVNPYLDPRSVEAQKRFIRAIVTRHRHSTHVDWDLINEPSMFDPKLIFSNGPRSCGDRYEREAFARWLRSRHGVIERLQERWNLTPEQLPTFDQATIPSAADINFDVQDMHQGKNGTRWLDYALFSMEMHNRWARELTAAIKEACPEHLVTVGQDEALGAQRPSPFFYAEAVDYTTVHSWWLNDQLLWDGIFAKTPDKPNLVQETGIMYVETPEGRAKRSEAELRNMLERKYAYAFATGGAGAVQWIWNTNFYMDNANESHIGAVRADGTEKPEADVSYDFGAFVASCRDLFRERKLEDVVVVFPYSNDLSNRKLAFDATTRATRALAYELKVPFRAVGEYHLDSLEREPAKLIVLPSAHNVDDEAMERLFTIVRSTGATLLITGPIGIDAYWRKTDRLPELLSPRSLSNVVREEVLQLAGKPYPVSYGARRIAEVMKETLADGAQFAKLEEVQLGQGRLVHCPLPVELGDRVETVSALYRLMLQAAGCKQELEWLGGGELPGVFGRKLAFAAGALYVFVSEYAVDAEIEVRDPDTGTTYAFTLPKERSILFAVNAEGSIIAAYRPQEVAIRAAR